MAIPYMNAVCLAFFVTDGETRPKWQRVPGPHYRECPRGRSSTPFPPKNPKGATWSLNENKGYMSILDIDKKNK